MEDGKVTHVRLRADGLRRRACGPRHGRHRLRHGAPLSRLSRLQGHTTSPTSPTWTTRSSPAPTRPGRTRSSWPNRYAAEYLRHLDDLNVLPADEYPRVSSEIPEIIGFIQELGEGGYAYELDGDVYFRVNKDDDYGKLSRRKLDAGGDRHPRRRRRSASSIPPILPCGSPPNPVNRPGTAPGDRDGPAGTSSAPAMCLRSPGRNRSTSTAAATT